VRYSSAVLTPWSGTADGVGSRAPHAWVRRGDGRISTLDLFDGRLTLLTGPDGVPWHRAVSDLADVGLPIAALAVGRDFDDEDGTFARRYRLGRTGAVLVRPDGYLAWPHPGVNGAGDAATELRAATDRALGRSDMALGRSDVAAGLLPAC
jgi:hypothetical protein